MAGLERDVAKHCAQFPVKMAAAAWRQINANAGLVTLESRVKQISVKPPATMVATVWLEIAPVHQVGVETAAKHPVVSPDAPIKELALLLKCAHALLDTLVLSASLEYHSVPVCQMVTTRILTTVMGTSLVLMASRTR